MDFDENIPSPEQILALSLLELIEINDALIIDCNQYKFLISHSKKGLSVQCINDNFDFNHFQHGQRISLKYSRKEKKYIPYLKDVNFIPLKQTIN